MHFSPIILLLIYEICILSQAPRAMIIILQLSWLNNDTQYFTYLLLMDRAI